MARESVEARAVRLLAEGRVRVVLVDGERIEARVRGSEADHSVGYQRGGWWCHTGSGGAVATWPPCSS
jgi:hypothetical protein